MREWWFRGVWLGKRCGTDEHIVIDSHGRVVRARTVRPDPEGKTWDRALFYALIGTTWDPSGAGWSGEGERPREAQTDVPRAVAVDEPIIRIPVARRVPITREYLVDPDLEDDGAESTVTYRTDVGRTVDDDEDIDLPEAIMVDVEPSGVKRSRRGGRRVR